jgi:hypothetical protein
MGPPEVEAGERWALKREEEFDFIPKPSLLRGKGVSPVFQRETSQPFNPPQV